MIAREARRFNIVDCGRRWGKTTLGLDRALRPALDGQPVAWFSPTYKMLTEVWREFVRRLQPVTAALSVQQHRIELVTGGLIEMWSLDSPDVARGRRYARVIIDEAAMVGVLEFAWQEVIRPTLTDLRGDAWFLSTPRGRGYFWQLWSRGQDAMEPDWASWQRPTSDNPYIDPAEIAAAARELPERVFRQEFLAEFLEDSAGVFRRVRAAATATPVPRAVPGHQYVIGVDWGKHDDFTVLVALDLTDRCQVALDRFNQIDYAVQLARLRAMVERYEPAAIIAERNSMGEPLIEQLLREGLPVQPFTTTNATKQAAIDALALAFERADIRILDDPVLVTELEAYEMERLPSGLLRYAAPPGMHDDCVMALALAWQGVVRFRPTGGIWV